MGKEETEAKLTKLQENFREAREISSNWSSGYRELMLSSDTQAIEFAKLVIQSLLLIHGGAVVAIPTFWDTFADVVKSQTFLVWLVFTVFTIGLFCAVVAAALGFHSLANRADGNLHMTFAANHQAWLHIYHMQEAGGANNLKEIIQVAQKNAAEEEAIYWTYQTTFQNQRAVAMSLLWASIICLIVGAVSGLVLVSS